MIFVINYDSPIGELLIAEKENALIGIFIKGQKHFLYSLKQEKMEYADSAILNQTKQWLERYFEGEKPEIDELTLAPKGTEFQKKVWKILCEIPYGNTITYGEIAKKIATKMSAQAVGGAVGHNPISIVIPCHRVVGANGNLTGYAGGMENKIKLLAHEGVDMEKMFVPVKK